MKHWITYEAAPHGSPISFTFGPFGSLATRPIRTPPTDAEARLLNESLGSYPNAPIPGKGYPTFHVLIDGLDWRFGSIAEIDLALRTLSQRHLPNVRSHAWWVNRLPRGTTAWTKRQRIVRALAHARADFEKEVATKSRHLPIPQWRGPEREP